MRGVVVVVLAITVAAVTRGALASCCCDRIDELQSHINDLELRLAKLEASLSSSSSSPATAVPQEVPFPATNDSSSAAIVEENPVLSSTPGRMTKSFLSNLPMLNSLDSKVFRAVPVELFIQFDKFPFNAHKDVRSRQVHLSKSIAPLKYVLTLSSADSGALGMFPRIAFKLNLLESGSFAVMYSSDLVIPETTADISSFHIKLVSKNSLKVVIGFEDGWISSYSLKFFKHFMNYSDPISEVAIGGVLGEETGFSSAASHQVLPSGVCGSSSVRFASLFGFEQRIALSELVAVHGNDRVFVHKTNLSDSIDVFDGADHVTSWTFDREKTLIVAQGRSLKMIRKARSSTRGNKHSGLIGECLLPSNLKGDVTSIVVDKKFPNVVYATVSDGRVLALDVRSSWKALKEGEARPDCSVLSFKSVSGHFSNLLAINRVLVGFEEEKRSLHVFNISSEGIAKSLEHLEIFPMPLEFEYADMIASDKHLLLPTSSGAVAIVKTDFPEELKPPESFLSKIPIFVFAVVGVILYQGGRKALENMGWMSPKEPDNKKKSSSVYGGKFRTKDKVEEEVLARFRNFKPQRNNRSNNH